MTEVRVLAPTAVIGSGFSQKSFERGLSLKPHVIGCDGGSTDMGPAALGTGVPHFSRDATKRDLRLMLRGRERLGVPLIVGSCGTAGGDAGVDWMREICLEIAKEEGLRFRLALVRSEQEKGYLKRRLREGRIRPLNPAPDLNEKVIDRSAHIVGMMGAEPIMEALGGGAEVVLAGRASDTAIFASVPLRMGADPGPAWHAGKILECGTSCATHRKRPDSVFAWIREGNFTVEPMDTDLRCTPQSVAAHSLYENADPHRIVESAGLIETGRAAYEAEGDRAVRVTGSAFREAEEYTVKLEGAERAGYQAVIVGGVRDPFIIRQLDPWLEGIREEFAGRVEEIYGDGARDYTLVVRVYGRDAVMGELEPLREALPHEVGLLFEVTAPSRGRAMDLAATLTHLAIHYPIPEWHGLISGIAFPFAPAELEKGEVYRFSLNHVVLPEAPCEMFRTEMLEA